MELLNTPIHEDSGAIIGEDKVILVNERDEAIGIEDKTQAHLQGLLHRAFSIFVINTAGQLLLQKRALTKYHSGGLWSNTCCGHPRPGESVEIASNRRLREEMGLELELTEVFNFLYSVKLDDGFIENEYDHVLVGLFEGLPQPDPAEIAEWQWMDMTALSVDLQEHSENYTYWFRISFDRFLCAVTSKLSTV